MKHLLTLALWILPQIVSAVTLSWDVNPVTTDPNTKVVGYHLNQGTKSHSYSSKTDTGSKTSVSLSPAAGTYYWAVSAYNAAGIDGPMSNEVTLTIAASPTPTPTPTPTPVPTPTPTGVTNGTTIPIAVGQTKVTVFAAGNYKLMGGGIVAPTVGQNSFWIDFDKDPTNDETRCWDFMPVSSTARTFVTTWRGASGNESLATINPKIWTLSTGVHTIYLMNREPGTIIKTVQFVLVPVATPTPTPTPTPTYNAWLSTLNAQITAGVSPAQLTTWLTAHPPTKD